VIEIERLEFFGSGRPDRDIDFTADAAARRVPARPRSGRGVAFRQKIVRHTVRQEEMP